MSIFSKTESCGFCDRCFSYLYIFFHIISEVVFTLLLFVRLFFWQLNQLRKLSWDSTNIPCRLCKHSARVHFLEFETNSEPQIGANFTAFEVFKTFNFEKSEPTKFTNCIICTIKEPLRNRKKVDSEDQDSEHYYFPLTNLEYLEYKYQKGAKNETTRR